MPKRGAICIGVNQAGSMPALQAAAKGGRDFEAWAKRQGCDTELLVDEAGRKIGVTDVYDAIKARVDTGAYEQLIIYFSGHGILGAPGCEYWLLSRAPENPNEAVNLFRAIEDARSCGIPHIVFVSDACRSRAAAPPLTGVMGGTVFGHTGYAGAAAEIDVFYATRPGDPAWEVALDEATRNYSSIFTDFLLEAVTHPIETQVEEVDAATMRLNVVSSRKLKEHLEAVVPVRAGERDVRIRQTPQLRVESALPKYFATVDAAAIERVMGALPPTPAGLPPLRAALRALEATHFSAAGAPLSARDAVLIADTGLGTEVDRLSDARGRGHFETRTGFTVYGAQPVDVAAVGWGPDPSFPDPNDQNVWHIRLNPFADPAGRPPTASIVFRTRDGRVNGTLLAVMPDFIGAVVIDDTGRVQSVSYAPAENAPRYDEYRANARRLERMRAFAAVAARNGSFTVENESVSSFASRIRQGKAIDPSLGLYAAYAYAQIGAYGDVSSVYHYMQGDPDLPVPFDVAMLASRWRENEFHVERSRFAPFAPMLSQGWALLADGDPMFRPIHARLRPHLLPSLWTTLDEQGALEVSDHIRSGGA